MNTCIADRRAKAIDALLGGKKNIGVAISEGMNFGGHLEALHIRPGVFEQKIIVPNLIPAAFRSIALRSIYHAGTQYSSYYIAPYVNNVVPDDTIVMADFNTVMLEYINYTQSTRRAWTQDTEASQLISNAGALASITIGPSGGTISGIALCTIATKSTVTGLLAAVAAFADPRTVIENDILQLKYTVEAPAPV